MTKINVVTTFSPLGYDTYGKHMLRSFNANWPKDVQLYVYHESSIPTDAEAMSAIWVNLDRDQDRAAFMASHSDGPRDGPHAYKKWPVKFCHKVFAVTSAPRDCDWMIWMDGDVRTMKPITWDFLHELLPKDEVLGVFLGRRWWSHTETGFWAIRMNGYGKHFLDELRNDYTSDRIMTSTSQIDCAAFDYCLQIFEGRGQKFKDLGAHHKGPDIDVMAKSVLAPYLWHAKGEYRKLKEFGKVA